MDNYKIYKLLKCISLIENFRHDTCMVRFLINVHCNYCGVLMNAVSKEELHYACSEKCLKTAYNFFHTIKEHVCDERRRILPRVTCLMDELQPFFVKGLLKQLSHETLFQFALACPQYLPEILNPIYWKSIRFLNLLNTDYRHFTNEEIFDIMFYLNINLNELIFTKIKAAWANGNILCRKDSNVKNSNLSLEQFIEFLDVCPNIKCLDLPGVFSNYKQERFLVTLNEKLNHLMALQIEMTESFLSTSKWLKLLCNFKNLHSISINTDYMKHVDIVKLIKEIKLLIALEVKTFGMYHGEEIDDQTLQIIYDQHGPTVEKIELTGSFSDDGFKNIDKCVNLKYLKLECHSFIKSSESIEILFRLRKIEIIKIFNLETETGNLKLSPNIECLPSLKEIFLYGFRFDTESNALFTNRFPSAESIVIHHRNLGGEIPMLTVKYLLKRCTNIKRFGLPSFKLDIPEFSIYIDFHYKPNVDNDYLQILAKEACYLIPKSVIREFRTTNFRIVRSEEK